jgi:hypothetical protein
MKKYKLFVEIHGNGSCNDAIIRMVTNHNEGKSYVTLGLIKSYCHAKYAEFPTITPVMKINENIGKKTVDIFEIKKGDEVPTLTIKESDVLLVDAEQTVQPEYHG